MMETEDLLQLRLLSLKLLRQLQVGQYAVERSVAKAASESGRNSRGSYDPEMPLSPKTSSISSQASGSQDRHHMWDPLEARGDDPCDVTWLDRVRSRVVSQPPIKCQHLEPLGQPRSHSAPSLTSIDSKKPAPSAGLHDPAPRSIPAESKQSKSRVTFCQEPAISESNWRLWPYLGYDWIVESLDSSSPVTSKPEAFFSRLRQFRETNREECVHSAPEPQFPGLCDSGDEEADHECVYCYRVNRRLFLVPLDPGVPCRLCGTPRDQRGPDTLAEPTQVRVSLPLSILDPPHQYPVHRRKSFDASDTLALPRHCLLGWDILPPKSEKSTAPKSLDLWSSVTETRQQEPPASSSSRLALPVRVPPPTPVWLEPQVTWPRALRQKP
ncbi:migration and invasion-inhibitory protein isoform X1 [Sciurus carolinensis]|uniref:migration and invasion-inhibitory protein isoform X1 n=2 Tax=Sciurus carolinensis TaxID=30640 RepID=UPI001FB2A8EB|nr:migration and invasion-inhibitory protein isoform X1 [Sciurus carolinensis]XP_047384224.1 migration and invasion-inhibitory protein isoform X1 [Sciurus carolinensis]